MIILNDKSCHVTYTADDDNEVLGFILTIAIPQLKYMSMDGMKQWIIDALDFIIQSREEIGAKENKPFIRKSYNIKEYLKTEITHERMILVFTNLALGNTGLGTLPGFRFSGVPKASKINPELVSMYDLNKK